MKEYPLLDSINSPLDIKHLNIEELEILAQEIRKFLLDNVSKTGGHLASNLGIVELTLALHYVFNSPFDKLIWDVGHQAYVHKILTQRKDIFCTLRQFGGLSGFPKKNESVHDIFETGHSSTSISAALGMARARDLKGEKGQVIAIIGDGALTGGMVFEALNDAGHSRTNMIVILNDNEMSISKNIGALSTHLSKIRSNPRYTRLKKEVNYLINKFPIGGKYIARIIERLKNSFKYLLLPGIIFEEMGFTYMGPIDGHNIANLIYVIKRASRMSGPILIHAVTKKGKGYSFAEKNPELYHGVPPFNIETGIACRETATTYSKVFGQKLVSMAEKDQRIVAITAAMPEGTGLMEFKQRFSERFFDVCIAEQHAVTMAAGMANSGMRPYVAIYSTFLQRAYDQILHDVCLQNLPVVFCIDRAGLVGQDGETHQGIFDISFLRHMPNITILAPKDIIEFKEMLDYSLSSQGPIAIRYPKGADILATDSNNVPFEKCEWEYIYKNGQCVILAVGRMIVTALKAAQLLKKENIDVAIVNARVIKPLDEKFLLELAQTIPIWITLEDNVIQGGLGSSINEFVNKHNCTVSVTNFGIPDKFIPHGKVETLFKYLGLDADGVAWKVKKTLSQNRENFYVNY